MRAYRVKTATEIAPYGDPVRDLWVGTQTVEQWQRDACDACGLELSEVESVAECTERPCIVFFDDVFFTEMALRNFVADVMSSNQDHSLALPESPAVRAVAPASDATRHDDGSTSFDVFYLKSTEVADGREALRVRCSPSVQRVIEKSQELKLPRVRGGKDTVDAVLTARVVAHVRHWIHLLRLGQLAVGVRLLDRLRKEPRKILKLRLKGTRDPWAIARELVFVHPTARVHPTADLEAAIIGPGATVRAHAHVHNSVIGADVDIGDHSAVMGCVLAEGVQVLRGTYIAHCSAMPGGTLASYKVQLSLFGRDVFLTSSAWLLDAKLRGEIRIEHEGELIPIGSAFLGACLGHRVTLGARASIQSGRAVPNGVTIIGPPGQVALDLPGYAEGTLLTVRNGRAVPLDEGES